MSTNVNKRTALDRDRWYRYVLYYRSHTQ